MKENKEFKISFWASHNSTIITVTLVLIMVGILAIIGLVASTEKNKLHDNLEISIVMADDVSDESTAAFAETIKSEPYVQSITVITKAEALKNWQEELDEDLEATFGLNPLSPEVAVTLHPDFATPARVEKIKHTLEALPEVEGVGAPDSDMLESIDHTAKQATWILAVIGGVFLIISIFLINNTVHLSIYSRRFTIHTMQLVGATDGFIRRPIVRSNALAGIIAGAIAALLIIAAIAYAMQDSDIPVSEINIPALWAIFISLPLTGALICGVAAWVASTIYLRKDYDALFR